MSEFRERCYERLQRRKLTANETPLPPTALENKLPSKRFVMVRLECKASKSCVQFWFPADTRMLLK